MLVVETIAKIRRSYFVQKKPIKAIRAGLENLGFDGQISSPNAGSNSNPGQTSRRFQFGRVRSWPRRLVSSQFFHGRRGSALSFRAL